MRGLKKRPSSLVWLWGLMALVVALPLAVVAQVELRLNETAVTDGDEIVVPIEIAGAQTDQVLSYFFRLEYDAQILRAVGVEADGTLSENMALSANRRTPGVVVVAAGGGQGLPGPGTLVKLRFEALVPGVSPLQWGEITFNEGLPEGRGRDADIVVIPIDPDAVGPFGEVEVGLPTQSGRVGDEVLVPVRIEGGDAIQVLSYFFRLSYDPFVLQVLGVETAGTLSESMLVIPKNTRPGELEVAATQAAELDGDGVLLNIRFLYVGRGTSPMVWDSFVFNEGDPVARTTAADLNAVLGSVTGIEVRLPQLNGTAGQTELVDIEVGSLAGQGVFSYLLRLGVDPRLVQVRGVSQEGTLSAQMAVDFSADASGLVRVAASGVQALAGSGSLVRLEVKYLAGGQSPLRWGNVLFNEGAPQPNAFDGTAQIAGRPPSEHVGDFDGDGVVGFQDLFLFADQFGSDISSQDWDPVYDVAESGLIDLDDLSVFSAEFGFGL
jgi:hypothetical protein